MDNRAIFKNIFGKDLADEASKSMLEKIATDYPYFTPAQFYLLQQTPENTVEYSKQANRTSLLFNNNWWLNFQLQQTTNPAPIIIPEMKEPEGLMFEPMHVVDYFASQGIKLSEEEQTKDKLGKQMKSFTEWLKSMKKLPSGDSNSTVQPIIAAESSIPALAEKSNEEGEVVTEAMAEVLAMQGKLARSIAVYEKLSLMNPSKSAYFAAKIEKLKES